MQERNRFLRNEPCSVPFGDRTARAPELDAHDTPLDITSGGLSANHGQKRELGGVTISRGDLTSPGPLQKGVYS